MIFAFLGGGQGRTCLFILHLKVSQEGAASPGGGAKRAAKTQGEAASSEPSNSNAANTSPSPVLGLAPPAHL